MVVDSDPVTVLGFGQFGRFVARLLQRQVSATLLCFIQSDEAIREVTRIIRNEVVIVVCDENEPLALEFAATQTSEMRSNGNYVLAVLRELRFAEDGHSSRVQMAGIFDAHVRVARRNSASFSAVVVTDVAGMFSSAQLTSVDVSDVRSVWTPRTPLLCGIGYGSGKDRTNDAVRRALSSISDTSEWSSTSAGMFVIVSGGRSLRLSETRKVTNRVRSMDVDEKVRCYLGTYLDDFHGHRVRVTLLAGCALADSKTPLI